jgi:hypothetical protein
MNTPGFKESVDSAEQAMKLHEAFSLGCRAGQLSRSPSLNEYPEGTPEHAEWERGRMSTSYPQGKAA